MIFSPFERLVAIRYLRARRAEGFVSLITWLSLLGIAIGVAALITVMSVMSGYRDDLFSRVLGLNGHLNIYSDSGPFYDYAQLIDQVGKLQDVTDIAPTVEGQALVSQNGSASGVYVRGVEPDAMRRRPNISQHITFGSLNDFDVDRIAIGVRMAERLHVTIGDNITLISPVGKSTLFGSAPRMRGYKVAAVFDVGMYEYDNNFIFMPLQAAQTFFVMGNGVSALEVFVTDPQHVGKTTREILETIHAPGHHLVNWQQNNSSFYAALEVERTVMGMILTLIVVVAAFNIISSLIMLVKDKASDIAILRTMGATRGMIMRIFFLSGASIGTVGTALGLVLGVVITKHLENIRQFIQYITKVDPFASNVYILTHFPSTVDWSEVWWIVLMALGLSFAFTLYPAWRAAKLEPVEALRYE